jgi:hypothetical protein
VPSKILILDINVFSGIVNIMFVRVKITPNSPRKSVQIVGAVRRGDKVSQKIVRHVGIVMDDQELNN